MENIFRMSLFMPPISPIRDKISGKNLKNATLTPLRTVDVNEVHKLITSNAKLAALTHEVRNAALLGDDNACRSALYLSISTLHPSTSALHPSTSASHR